MGKVIDIESEKDEMMTDEDFFRRHKVRAHLWPRAWKSALQESEIKEKVPLWNTVRLGRDPTASVPKERGIYALRIRIEPTAVPDSGLIAYFGISTELYSRYCKYISDKRSGLAKQKKIRRLLLRWGDHLDFIYWVIEDKSCALMPIEKSLNSAVMAPFATKDFNAKGKEVSDVL